MTQIFPTPLRWHDLKCDTEPFAAVALGLKRAEFRRDDRGFQVHDGIRLHERVRGRGTGRTLECIVTHVQTGYGIPAGYCMLSVEFL